MDCTATKKDGTPCKGKAKKDGLCVFHLPRAATPFGSVPQDVVGAPAKIKGMHRAAGPELDYVARDIKLVRPICRICAPDVERAGHGWWNRCPHDPYMGEKGEPVTSITYKDELDDEGNVIGRVVDETTTKVVLRPYPNWAPVAQSLGLNGGRGPEYKKVLYGFIEPQDLRSPAFPNGIAPCCEFRDCFWQDDLTEYAVGTFCQEREAVAVYEDTNGTVVEINNSQVRADQLAVSRMKLLTKAN